MPMHLTGSDLRVVWLRCKKDEEGWSSIFIRRRVVYTSSRKAISKVLPRNLPSSRNSLACNLRICWEPQQKMLLKRLSVVWYQALVESVFLLILRGLIINNQASRSLLELDAKMKICWLKIQLTHRTVDQLLDSPDLQMQQLDLLLEETSNS